MLPLVLACQAPETTPHHHAGSTSSTTTPTTTDTTGDTTGATGDTGTPGTTPPIDCGTVPDAPLSVTELNIETTEDFDFDADGHLVYAEWLGSTLWGVEGYGGKDILATGVHDTRGIQTLSTGEIAIAFISDGVVGTWDPATHSIANRISGLSGPNALEVDEGDILYVSETGGAPRVLAWDLTTGTSTPVAAGFTYPNGLALNETKDILYVSDSSNGIWAVPKNGDGTWGDKYLVVNPDGFESYDGMEVDACGNFYVLGFNTGQVYRFDPTTDPIVGGVYVELSDPQAFLWNSIRWGSDIGGWRRDVLYVTDRNKVFAVETGVRGADQPVDLVP